MNKKLYALVSLVLVLSLSLGSAFYFFNGNNLNINGDAGLNVQSNQQQVNPTYKVDATIYFTREPKPGEVVLVGSWTKMGINATFGKITGLAASYNMTQYLYNVTSMSIGNQGVLNTDSTVLPGEWNRTAVTPHDALYNSINYTAVFKPDAGPYTADAFGLNIGPVTIGLDYTLIAYDTFTEVTGIDNTFTITGEFRIYSTSA